MKENIHALFLSYSEHMQMDRVLSMAISVEGLEKCPNPKFKVSWGKIALTSDERKNQKQGTESRFSLCRGLEYGTANMPLWHNDHFELKVIN